MNWKIAYVVLFLVCLSLSQPVGGDLEQVPLTEPVNESLKYVPGIEICNGDRCNSLVPLKPLLTAVYEKVDYDAMVTIPWCERNRCYICQKVSEKYEGKPVPVEKSKLEAGKQKMVKVEHSLVYEPGLEYCQLVDVNEVDYIHFGEESTIVKIETSDPGGQDDYFDEDGTVVGNEANMLSDNLDGGGEISFVKLNHSIPAGSTVENTTLCMYFGSDSDASNENLDVWRSSNQTWVEGEIDAHCGDGTWDAACLAEFQAAGFFTTNLLTHNGVDGAAGWDCIDNLHSGVQADVDASNIYTTFTLNCTGDTNDYYRWETKEGVTHIPYANFTYLLGAGDSTAPTVTLKAPTDASSDADGDITAICHINDAINVTNVTLYHNITSWHANSTNYSSANNVNYSFSFNIPSGNTALWNCYACDNSSNCGWGTSNWTVSYNLSSGAASNYTWMLSFIERHQDIGYYGILDIIIDGTVVASLNTSDGTNSYGYQEYDISSYMSDSGGENITLKFRSPVSGIRRTSMMIYNITLTRDGEWVKFTPWSYYETNALFRQMDYHERRIVLHLPISFTPADTDYHQFESAAIVLSPELVIRQSGLAFNDTIYNISEGDAVEVNTTVYNIGSATEDNCTVNLYINDVLNQTSSGSSIANGSSQNFTFNLVVPSLPAKITVEAVPNATEGMTSNNNATKTLVTHPYIAFTDFSATPGAVYSASEPYASWIADIASDANTYESYDYSSTGMDEYDRCHYAKIMALNYQITGDTGSANMTAEALAYLGNGEWSGGDPFTWANRSHAGNESDDQYYNLTICTGSPICYTNYKAMAMCGEAYDWAAEYIEENRSDVSTIRDNLFHMALDLYLKNKEIFAYESQEGDTRGIIGDEHTVIPSMLSSAATIAMALPDYDGAYQDTDEIEGSPSGIYEYSVDNYLRENKQGAVSPFLDMDTLYDGAYGEGDYKTYLGYQPMPMIYAYLGLTGTNLVEESVALHGYLYEDILRVTPVKTFPTHTPVASNNLLCIHYMTPGLFSGEEREAINWYVENVLQTYEASWSDKRRYSEGCSLYQYAEALAFYNSSETAAAYEPDGEASWIRLNASYNLLRSGYGTDDLSMSFFVTNESTETGGHAHRHGDQMSYDLFAYGAYLLVDSGDPRWLYTSYESAYYKDIGTTWGKGPGGHNTILFNETTSGYVDGIKRHGQTIYPDDQTDVSQVDAFMTSADVDWLAASIGITEGQGLSERWLETETPDALANPIDWLRNILFVDNAYYVVADRLVSADSHDYKMLLHFGSTEHTETNDTIYTDQYAVGNLTINGTAYPWRNTTLQNDSQNDSLFILPYTDVSEMMWATLTEARNTTEEASRTEVNISVWLNPTMDVDLNVSVGKYGAYGGDNDFFHPYATCKQTGKEARYLTVLVPLDTGSSSPTVTQLTVTGSGYATLIENGTNRDIAYVKNGTGGTADYLLTDCTFAFIRNDTSSGWEYFLCYNGTDITVNGTALIAPNETIDYAYCNRSGNNITCKLKNPASNPVNMTMNVHNSSDINISLDESLLTEGTDWDQVDATTIWVQVTFASEVLLEVVETGSAGAGDSTPPDLTFVSPTLANNSYTDNVSWIYWNISGSEALSACLLDNTTVNQSMTVSGSYCYLNQTGLANMTSQYVTVYGNDTSGNMNRTEFRNITVNLSSIAYTGFYGVTLISPADGSNITTDPPGDFIFNFTGEYATANCTLWINFGNYGSVIASNDTATTITTTGSLATDGLYDWYVNCTNGTDYNTSSAWSFTRDTTCTVTGVSESVTDQTATVSWTTSENANGSLTITAGSWSNSSAFGESHSITVSNLIASTTYAYTVTSCDTHGNCGTSSDSLTTADAPSGPSGGGGSSGGTPLTIEPINLSKLVPYVPQVKTDVITVLALLAIIGAVVYIGVFL